MTYEAICRYVFASEKVKWQLHDSKVRKRELVFARQASIYLYYTLHPKETWNVLGAMFGKDHATAMHSVKTINNLMFSDIKVRIKISEYLKAISDHEAKVKESKVRRILRAKKTDSLDQLLKIVDNMELVAQIYCEITNSKLVKQTAE